MEPHELEVQIKNIDGRIERIEQILPTLATKEDLKAEGERTRRHFDVVAERIKTDVEKVAEGHAVSGARIDGLRAELKADIADHEQRITRLEINQKRK